MYAMTVWALASRCYRAAAGAIHEQAAVKCGLRWRSLVRVTRPCGRVLSRALVSAQRASGGRASIVHGQQRDGESAGQFERACHCHARGDGQELEHTEDT